MATTAMPATTIAYSVIAAPSSSAWSRAISSLACFSISIPPVVGPVAI